MNTRVYKELDDLCRDFKKLSSGKKKRVVKTARLLLKVQRQGRKFMEDQAGSGGAPGVRL
ncbi:hypothetical protein FACS1894110_08280 [Spirochaetia bacterium]|nr:hypothetical protein FACS1894110_08280 [Spirochaetia bacterium]